MTRYSIPALLAFALCTVGAIWLTTLQAAPAVAQAQKAAATCPQTLPSGATELTCQCLGRDNSTEVWGTDFYTDDSDLCNAAVHAGAMPATGGVIMVRTEPGRESYVGTQRNGISSRDYGRWGRTIVFEGGGSFESVAACPGTYNANGTGWSGTCTCAGTGNGSVWGTGPYTADSDLCRAARHAGVIGSAGGVVRVTPAPGQASYTGSTRNGVTTSRWGAYDASFRVSQ